MRSSPMMAEQAPLSGFRCLSQSAPCSHVSLQAEQEYQKAQLPGGFPAWSPRRMRMLIGVSGVYNCFDLADHFHRWALKSPQTPMHP